MANFSDISQMKTVQLIVPTSVTTETTTASSILDMQGFDSVTFIIYGEVTDGTFTPLVNESNDSGMSGESAVADIDLQFIASDGSSATSGQEASAAIDSTTKIHKIGYTGDKRYLTCDIVSTSTATNGGIVGVIAVLTRAHVGAVES